MSNLVELENSAISTPTLQMWCSASELQPHNGGTDETRTRKPLP